LDTSDGFTIREKPLLLPWQGEGGVGVDEGAKAHKQEFHHMLETTDPFDLVRFITAQAPDYDRALREIRAGQKRTHWMWYIFPQLNGLAFSAMSQRYAIKSAREAQAYLDHPALGPRLLECVQAALNIEGRTAREIFGTPDDLKLRSCTTLFASVSPPGSVFHRLLEKYYDGVSDPKTLDLLKES
jgi:uncharacterized protein (DUF1810 family)